MLVVNCSVNGALFSSTSITCNAKNRARVLFAASSSTMGLIAAEFLNDEEYTVKLLEGSYLELKRNGKGRLVLGLTSANFTIEYVLEVYA